MRIPNFKSVYIKYFRIENVEGASLDTLAIKWLRSLGFMFYNLTYNLEIVSYIAYRESLPAQLWSLAGKCEFFIYILKKKSLWTPYNL